MQQYIYGLPGYVVNLEGDNSAAREEARKGVPALKWQPNLYEDILLLSKNAGMEKPPLVFVCPTEGIGIASVKWQGKNVVLIDSFFLESFSRQELKGVAGHEIAHITLGHVDVKRPAYPNLAQLAKLRQDERDADLEGALIAGEVDGAIKAFKRVKKIMGSSGPSSVYADHPSERSRVRDLRKFSRQHRQELQESKTRLAALQAKLEKDFAAAAALAKMRSSADVAARRALGFKLS